MKKGGARQASGPKHKVSSEFRSGMAKALKKKCRETGISIQEVITDAIYDPETPAYAKKDLFKVVAQVMLSDGNLKEDFIPSVMISLPEADADHQT